MLSVPRSLFLTFSILKDQSLLTFKFLITLQTAARKINELLISTHIGLSVNSLGSYFGPEELDLVVGLQGFDTQLRMTMPCLMDNFKHHVLPY